MLISLLSQLGGRRCCFVYELRAKATSPKLDKVPVNAHGFDIDHTQPANWTTGEEAFALALSMPPGPTGHPRGVGISLSESLGVGCIDLDACAILDADGRVVGWSQFAIAMCARFPGAAFEVSQSGKALHILFTYDPARVPEHRTRKKDLAGLECYTRNRFIALTGNGLVGDLRTDCTESLQKLIADYLPEPVGAKDADWFTEPYAGWRGGGTDDQIIFGMLNRRSAASAFGGAASFRDLWEGNTDALAHHFPDSTGSNAYDRSAADQALANHLAYACGYNSEHVLRLMHRSALTRDKYDRDDYLPRTITRAVAGRREEAEAKARDSLAQGTSAPPPPLPVGITGIPKAQHRCTDQANAERLQQRHGDRLIACAGTFYASDGKRWKADDQLPQRFACELSKMVRDEAKAVRVKMAEVQASPQVAEYLAHPRKNEPQGAELFDLEQLADALDKWSIKCEMKSTQDAALGLLKKLLSVDVDQLDADPWLLNCENGTVDLRTGQLREHRSADFITRLAPVKYDPAAKAPRFRQFLDEIFAGDAVLIAFLARWFGYATTGSVREEKLVFHWGKGSNGKTTLIETIESVLGDYATTAPPELLTAKNGERHPAEIADLHGRRMVTASESEDGAKLREAFIKQTTGGDRLKGRRFYGQWFEFSPTHKLQLLTNHKPEIRGSDFAIWRRILLVPYMQKFGSPEQVGSGDADRLGDPTLKESLKAELTGVLAWIVNGAHEWYLQGGLRPPPVVLAASNDYRTEQDRVGEFIRDSCRLDIKAWSTVGALYQAYQMWCNEAGIHPLSRQRFMREVERSVPGFQTLKRGGVRGATGIALVAAAFGGFAPAMAVPPPPQP